MKVALPSLIIVFLAGMELQARFGLAVSQGMRDNLPQPRLVPTRRQSNFSRPGSSRMRRYLGACRGAVTSVSAPDPSHFDMCCEVSRFALIERELFRHRNGWSDGIVFADPEV